MKLYSTYNLKTLRNPEVIKKVERLRPRYHKTGIYTLCSDNMSCLKQESWYYKIPYLNSNSASSQFGGPFQNLLSKIHSFQTSL